MKAQCESRRGVVLLLTILTVALVVMLASTFLAGQSTAIGIARNLADQPCARAAAVSGLNLTFSEMLHNSTWRSDYPNGLWFENEPMGSASFSIVVEDGEDGDGDGVIEGDGDLGDDKGDRATVTSIGSCYGISHKVRTVVIPEFTIAGGAISNSITLQHNARVDSFDSSVGAYGGANIGQQAMLATNSVDNNNVSLHHDAVIAGDLYIGPMGTPADVINIPQDSVTITGEIETLDMVLPIPSVSAPSGMGASVGNLDYSSGTTVLASDVVCERFQVRNDAIVEISGNVRIVVNKDLIFKNTSQLLLQAGATLEVYSYEPIRILDDAQVNVDSADPSRLIIYHLQNNVMEVKSGALIYAAFISPNGTLDIVGNGHFCGTFFGKELQISDFGILSQDVNASAGIELEFMKLRWDEPI